jgi:hypothetical protein
VAETHTKNHKKVRLGAKKAFAIIGGAAALLLFAFLTYNVLITPYKQPYRDALSHYKNVYNANVAFSNSGAALSSSTATEQQFATNIKNTQAALAAITTETEALGKQKVLVEGEGKSLYDAFTTKLQAYTTYNTAVISSIQKVRPIVYDCSQKMATITENAVGAQTIQACADALAQVENVPDPDYATLATSFQATYADLAAVLGKIALLTDPKGADAAQYKVLSDDRTAILDTMNTVSTAFAKSLQAHRTAADITDAAKALDDYLSQKSSIF